MDPLSPPKSGSRTNITSGNDADKNPSETPEESQNNFGQGTTSSSNPDLQLQAPNSTGGIQDLINKNVNTNQESENNPDNNQSSPLTTENLTTNPANAGTTSNPNNTEIDVEPQETQPFISSTSTKKKTDTGKKTKSSDSQKKFLPASKPLQAIGLLAAIILVVSVAQLIIGALNTNNCSMNPYIPLYLIVVGVLGIVLALVLGALVS